MSNSIDFQPEGACWARFGFDSTLLKLLGSKIIFLQLNFIQIVNYRSIPKKIIFFRDSEICTVHEGLPPVIVHARLRPTVVLPAVCRQTRPSLKCLRDRVQVHRAGSITLGRRSKSKTDRNNSLRENVHCDQDLDLNFRFGSKFDNRITQ